MYVILHNISPILHILIILTLILATPKAFAQIMCTTGQFINGAAVNIGQNCSNVDYSVLTNAPTNVSNFTNDVPYLTVPNAASTYATQTSLTAGLATRFTIPTGTSGQYLNGLGAPINFPASGIRSFNYPSRALNSCFQISATQDADFHYKVDVTTGLSLTTGAQGTVTATSYTNSGCTTGAQTISDGTSSQTGTLVVGLGINQISDVGVDGTLQANHWMKITPLNTIGTPTFAIRAAQSEILLP